MGRFSLLVLRLRGGFGDIALLFRVYRVRGFGFLGVVLVVLAVVLVLLLFCSSFLAHDLDERSVIIAMISDEES